MDMHALVGKNNKLNKATRHVTNKKVPPNPNFRFCNSPWEADPNQRYADHSWTESIQDDMGSLVSIQ